VTALGRGPIPERDDIDLVHSPKPEGSVASPRSAMPSSFVVSFLRESRPVSATDCTVCHRPFASDEVYLRGELYTTQAKRWSWISLHEECVLEHEIVRQYFTGPGCEDFRRWFRDQEQRR